MSMGGHAEAKISQGVYFHGVCEKGCTRFWSKCLAVPVSWGTSEHRYAFFPRPQGPWEPGFFVTISIFRVEKNYLKLIECKLWRSFISDLIQGPRRIPSNMFTYFCKIHKRRFNNIWLKPQSLSIQLLLHHTSLCVQVAWGGHEHFWDSAKGKLSGNMLVWLQFAKIIWNISIHK